MIWGSRRINGVVYDLRHLDSFDMPVATQHPEVSTYNIRVSFGAHTFTRSLELDDTPDLHVQDGGVTRCFCVNRHGYSMHLPELVRASTRGRAYFGNKEMRYLLVEALPGLNSPYVIAFTVQKAKEKSHDATMFVVSAHERPDLPANLPAIKVATLLSLTMQGKPVVRPKRK
jgi:hypothetical protein